MKNKKIISQKCRLYKENDNHNQWYFKKLATDRKYDILNEIDALANNDFKKCQIISPSSEMIGTNWAAIIKKDNKTFYPAIHINLNNGVLQELWEQDDSFVI